MVRGGDTHTPQPQLLGCSDPQDQGIVPWGWHQPWEMSSPHRPPLRHHPQCPQPQPHHHRPVSPPFPPLPSSDSHLGPLGRARSLGGSILGWGWQSSAGSTRARCPAKEAPAVPKRGGRPWEHSRGGMHGAGASGGGVSPGCSGGTTAHGGWGTLLCLHPGAAPAPAPSLHPGSQIGSLALSQFSGPYPSSSPLLTVISLPFSSSHSGLPPSPHFP